LDFQTNVEFKGHFFDTLLLPKVLDTVIETGAECAIKQIEIGKSRKEESYIRLKVFSPNKGIFNSAIEKLKELGGKEVDIIARRVEIKGHIIDSLTLPKILDIIVNNGGKCVIENIDIGVQKEALSSARIKIIAKDEDLMAIILEAVQKNGAVPV